jgi:hypothetical protein
MRQRVLAAMVFALILAIVPVFKTAAHPICAAYTPDDPQWYLFFCYLKDAE